MLNGSSETAPQTGKMQGSQGRVSQKLRIGSCIVYEDHRFLVVNKPANLLVHPTSPGGPNTLWDELKQFLAYELVNGGRIAFVNRLDRETSGLILVGTVDFVADDGVSDMRKVDSDLVGPAVPGFRNDESKRVTIPQPAAQDTKFGEGRVAIGMNGLFKPDFRWAHSSLA